MLYSNKILLNKYNKTVPKTWNELIETSKYITERENDSELIAYNGLFDESEQGFCSLIEFIYSCRDSIDSSLPKLRSQELTNAFNLIKEIKDKLYADDIFRSDIDFSMKMFNEGKALFLKFWTIPYSVLSITPYKMTLLPGIKEGLSGSTVSGYNIGIDGSISEEKLNASILTLKYLTLKEVQRKYLLNENLISGITSLYNDSEVCAQTECENYKNIQLINRPTSRFYTNLEYSQKVMKYFHKFLYGNQPIESVVKKIDDLNRIYYINEIEVETIIKNELPIFEKCKFR
eukprot:jgi/Orpsp1_1/1185206/evm.model.c7180000092786.1